MDERVASAVAHWAPRFTANGVTVADFAAHHRHASSTGATGARPGWPWAPSTRTLGRAALAEGRLRSAGEHLAQAAVYHHFAKFVFVEDLDQMRAAHARAVACLDDALPHLDPPGRRVEIPFEAGSLVAVAPAAVPAPARTPSSCSSRAWTPPRRSSGSTEQTFLDRGLATFSVDGPGQGEAEYDVPIRGDWAPVAEVLWDDDRHRCPTLDRDRLAVWGVSLGGYYAARIAAALGDRAKACVALAGPFNFGECWDGLPQLTRDTFRVRSGAADADEARADRGHARLDGAASPADLVAPLLIVFGRQDRLIPWQHAERLRDAVSGPVELLMLEEGNHGCANVSPWHRPYTADWLAARLPAATTHHPVTTDCEGRLMMTPPTLTRPAPCASAGSAPAGWAPRWPRRLARAGEDVTVWNRTRAKAEPLDRASAATVADTIADLRGHDVVFTMVSTPADLEQVLTGEGGLLADPDQVPGVVVDCSTVSTESSAAMRAACAERGVDFLAVAGQRQRQGRARRRAHPGRLRPGGDLRPGRARCSTTSARARRTSARASVARLAKICHNLMLGVVTQNLAEITVLAEKGGVSRAAFLEFLNNSRDGLGVHPLQDAGVRAPRLHADVHPDAAAQGLRPRPRGRPRPRRADADRRRRPPRWCRRTRQQRPRRRGLRDPARPAGGAAPASS